METTDTPTYRLYSPSQITLAAFLGSPLAACWFFSRNYHALGRKSKGTSCLLLGAIVTALLLLIGFFLPERFPGGILSMVYIFALYKAADQAHGTSNNQHLAAGGRLGSWWKVVSFSLLFLLLILVVVFGVILALPEEA